MYSPDIWYDYGKKQKYQWLYGAFHDKMNVEKDHFYYS